MRGEAEGGIAQMISQGRISENNPDVEIAPSIRPAVMCAPKQERANSLKEWCAISEMVR